MREEGHLVVISVYEQTPFIDILDVILQLQDNRDAFATNSDASLVMHFFCSGEKQTKHAKQMEENYQCDPKSSLTGNLK